MKKINLNMKYNLPRMEKYARKHILEGLTVAAVLAAAFSAWTHLFWGTAGWSLLFLAAGAVAGIFWSKRMDMMLRKMYSFSAGSRMTMFVTEGAKILIALFIPFAYFALLGTMAGTAYQYYLHFLHSESKGSKAA